MMLLHTPRAHAWLTGDGETSVSVCDIHLEKKGINPWVTRKHTAKQSPAID